MSDPQDTARDASLPQDDLCGASALGSDESARLHALLIRYVRRHWPHEADIEDLAQEALLRLLRASVRAENAEAYVVQIASNLMRDRARRNQSRQVDRHTSLDDNIEYLPSEEPGCERVYESRRRFDRFRAALAGLPPRCREVFLLQRYEGLTYTAIAKRLGISVSAVEKHMMRALLHLQTRLDEA